MYQRFRDRAVSLTASMFLVVLTVSAEDNLKVGDAAPDFTLPSATKDSVNSSDLKLSQVVGKSNIVLAFYPADWSGGCTKEMCTMRDEFSSLSELGATILASAATTCILIASGRSISTSNLRC